MRMQSFFKISGLFYYSESSFVFWISFPLKYTVISMARDWGVFLSLWVLIFAQSCSLKYAVNNNAFYALTSNSTCVFDVLPVKIYIFPEFTLYFESLNKVITDDTVDGRNFPRIVPNKFTGCW